jgi:hypothetical protein
VRVALAISIFPFRRRPRRGPRPALQGAGV